MQVVEALKASALFKGFTDTGLTIMAGIAATKTYPQGVPLFAENMLADALIIVAEGSVHLSTKVKSGEEVGLGDLGPGDYLGELSLIQPGQRMCTATAAAPVTTVEIPHAEFQKLLAAKPQACLKLLMGVVSLFGQKVADNKDNLKAALGKG